MNLPERWGHLKLYDKNLLYYWGILSVLIVIFHRNLDGAFAQFLLHVSMIAILLWVLPWLDQKKGKAALFFRYWYMVLGLPFLYWDVGSFLRLVSRTEFDPLICNFEIFLFGTIPNISLQNYINPYLTEILQVSYSIYWITIPLGTLVFYAQKRYQHVEYLLYYVTITFFISYLFFIFLPVAGPRFHLADQLTASYEGVFLTKYLRGFMTHAGYRGGAFPSSHVAVALVILIFIWQFRPKLASRIFLPMVVALSLATVYGQYHYVTDVFAGLILGGTVGFWGGHRTRKKFTEMILPSMTPEILPDYKLSKTGVK